MKDGLDQLTCRMSRTYEGDLNTLVISTPDI